MKEGQSRQRCSSSKGMGIGMKTTDGTGRASRCPATSGSRQENAGSHGGPAAIMAPKSCTGWLCGPVWLLSSLPLKPGPQDGPVVSASRPALPQGPPRYQPCIGPFHAAG